MSEITNVTLIVGMPLIAGLVCLPLRRWPAFCGRLSVVILAMVFISSASLFSRGAFSIWWGSAPCLPMFMADGLSKLICLGIGFFSLVVGIYSVGFWGKGEKSGAYYGFLLMTEGAAMAAALADNFVLLLCAWGFLCITLYVLIGMEGNRASDVAKKALILVGGSDAVMVLGVALVYILAGKGLNPLSLGMSHTRIPLESRAALVAYLCLAAAAFAKAGVMPLHSWIPDCAEDAPLPVAAFLPASLDKLLGIYLLARISLNLFVMDSRIQLLLMAVGAATIVCAVMMAMVQHNMRRLLGYHAVSQVGYMVLGIGTGTPVGIAGGLFHMVNNCLYKTCLFLGAGAVGKRTGTSEMDNLGGLAGAMPVSFVSCLIAALAISGIPPLNGFASKWLVYQGILEKGKEGGGLWIVWLLSAMFGSALTLASFVKFLHATFLGQRSDYLSRMGRGMGEVCFSMWAPMIVLAALCVIFGVLAMPLALTVFIAPAVGEPVGLIGLWDSAAATWLIAIGIAIGLLIYRLSLVFPVRESAPFIGGEPGDARMAISGVDFYQTIKEMRFFRGIYKRAEGGAFDIYDLGRAAVRAVAETMRKMHSGLLPVYLDWCVVGILILLFVLMKT